MLYTKEKIQWSRLWKLKRLHISTTCWKLITMISRHSTTNWKLKWEVWCTILTTATKITKLWLTNYTESLKIIESQHPLSITKPRAQILCIVSLRNRRRFQAVSKMSMRVLWSSLLKSKCVNSAKRTHSWRQSKKNWNKVLKFAFIMNWMLSSKSIHLSAQGYGLCLNSLWKEKMSNKSRSRHWCKVRA